MFFLSQRNTVLRPLLKLTAMVVLVSTGANSDQQIPEERLKVKPTAIYQAVHGQALAYTLMQIAQRSGIVFKIDTDLGNDVVNQSISAENWQQAVKSLLVNYNYSLIQDGDNLKTVIITGRKQNAIEDFVLAATTKSIPDPVIVVERKLQSLPNKYKDFPAGAVTPINLPVKSLMSLKNKSTVLLDLPMGQFNVSHDNTVAQMDGSQTWVGHLVDEGAGYRMYLSQGPAGLMGWITTPDGSYDIQSDENGNNSVLIDNSQLQHAGYEGDTLATNVLDGGVATTANAPVAANATATQVAQLKLNVANAQTVLNTANAQVIKDQTALNTAKSVFTATQVSYASANSKNLQFYKLYTDAVTAYFAKPSTALLKAAYAAQAAWQAFQKELSTDISIFNAANTAYNTAKNNLTAAQKAAATALNNYNSALNTLNIALGKVPATSVTAATNPNGIPVVDLMVVYTSVAYTPAYAKQRIGLLVTATNQAYVDSHIKMQLRLVHTEPTAYIENNSNAQALADLAAGKGAFSTINATRSQYGADLVFLFRPLYAKTAGSCGTTYMQFANGALPDPTSAFGTIGDGNSVDGPGWICTENAFSHEIGHSLGLVHDRPYSVGSTGVFPYSYAWGVAGSFGTIMSYQTPVLMYFSTPLLATECKGQPCGYPQTDPRSSDQTASVNYTAPLVAKFMPTSATPPLLQ